MALVYQGTQRSSLVMKEENLLCFLRVVSGRVLGACGRPLHVHVRAGTALSAAWVLPGTHAVCLLLTCVPQRPDKKAQGHLCHQVRWGWALDSGPVKKG